MRLSICLAAPFITLISVVVALPILPSHDLQLRDTFVIRTVAEGLAIHTFEELERRVGQPYKVKSKPVKISKAVQQQRKHAVRSQAATRHVQKAITKQNLAAAYAKQVQHNPNFKYGKPRVSSKKKAASANKPGFRAAGRKKGFRLPKQPKTPKAQSKKGAPMTSKHQRTQAAAKANMRNRKAAGRDNLQHAKTEYGRTTHLPPRGATFTTPGGTGSFSGKDVRTAVFNQHHFANNPVNEHPHTFLNLYQGPPANRKRPLKMIGHGSQFPVLNHPGGYQGGKIPVGPARVVIQSKPNGHKFKGVVSHDERRLANYPGFMDHFKRPQIGPPRRRG